MTDHEAIKTPERGASAWVPVQCLKCKRSISNGGLAFLHKEWGGSLCPACHHSELDTQIKQRDRQAAALAAPPHPAPHPGLTLWHGFQFGVGLGMALTICAVTAALAWALARALFS